MVSGWVFFGAVFGFTTQIYTNALRKLPLTRYPWEYVICTVVGAGGGYYLDGAIRRAKDKVAELEAKRARLTKGPPKEVLEQ